VNGIHFLLTYSCTHECDHCFLHCSPEAGGTFTCEHLREVFGEIRRIGTVEMAYFEGGEAFLYYPLLLEGLRMAADIGLRAGIVTASFGTRLRLPRPCGRATRRARADKWPPCGSIRPGASAAGRWSRLAKSLQAPQILGRVVT